MSAIAIGVEPARRTPSALTALSRVEAGHFVRSWPFWVGLALTASDWARIDLRSEEWGGEAYNMVIGASWPFTYVGAFVAAVLIGARDRCGDATPLPTFAPVDGTTRTLARLLGGLSLGAIGAVAAVAGWVYLQAQGGVVVDDRFVEPTLLEFAEVPLLILLAVASGIAAAQLIPSRAAVIVGGSLLIMFTTVTAWVFGGGDVGLTPAVVYQPSDVVLPRGFDPATAPTSWITVPPDEFETHWRRLSFELHAIAWHLLYVVGLVLLVSALGLRTQGPSRVARIAAGAGLALAVVGGVTQFLVRSY